MSVTDSELPKTVMFFVGLGEYEGMGRKQGNVDSTTLYRWGDR